MTLRTLLLTAVATVSLAGSVYAAPITAGSQLSITGALRTVPDAVPVSDATGLDFITTGAASPGVPGQLTGATGTGSFASLGVCIGNCGTIQDILSFVSFAGQADEVVANLPGGTVSLDLNAPLTLTRTTADPSKNVLSGLLVAGFGTFHELGFDDTPAMFTLTTQGNEITTFSASATGSALPEPMSLTLLGTALLGAGIIRSRGRRS